MNRYTHLVLHALGAAIPHAFLLLHALLDCLPYPRSPRGLWYEIKTGSVECIDEVTVNQTIQARNDKNVKTKKRKRKELGNDQSGLNAMDETGKDGLDDAMNGHEASGEGIGGKSEDKEKKMMHERRLEEEEDDDDDDGVHETDHNVKSWLAGIGSTEANEPEINKRIKVSRTSPIL